MTVEILYQEPDRRTRPFRVQLGNEPVGLVGDPRESIEELALDFSLGERLVQGGDLDLQLSNFLVQIGGLVGTIVEAGGLAPADPRTSPDDRTGSAPPWRRRSFVRGQPGR